ncbi:MAG: carbamoyl phosphate synthase large subunit, partial [Opitutaceae bacterium]|nr:carbamoyl phosphate synthase large subunit [Opitutaceae bacterium]
GAPGWGAIPVSGGNSACFFSTRHAAGGAPDAGKPGKILILGGGPNRIGQGLEFDHGCVNAAAALREAGHAAVLVNCNPAAVSTDAALAGPLYLEPLTTGDVLEICEREKPRGVIAQFGGQVAAGVARGLAAAGVALLGTSAEAAAVAGDRGRFRELLKRLGIPTPEGGEAAGADEAVALAERLGYPVMARIADGRGGETAEVVHDAAMLRERVGKAGGRPVFLDRFLRDALECEADALADGEDVFIPAVMEHIELAGVHSGDAACVLPPVSLSPERVETMRAHTRAIARELRVAGLMNVQFAAGVEGVFVLKATPRASRTVPLVSKVCGLPLARLAARLALGAKLADLKLPAGKTIPRFGVKESVFPFGRFPDVDPVLGPEMRSTGSVLGLSPDFGLAFRKSQEAAQSPLPSSGAVLISVRERVPQVLEIARTFAACGFRLKATSGTRRFLADNGIAADLAVKINEGRPDIADDIRNRLIQLVINTPVDRRGAYVDDSYIRKAAIRYNVPCMTTLAAAAAAARGVAALRGAPDVIGESLQEYHAGLR